MSYDNFDHLFRQLQQHYRDGEYTQALALATHGLERFPENRTVLDYWRMTMAARTGDEELALRVLVEALEHGEWYSELLLRRSPSFQPLQGQPRFERLVALNQQVAEADQEVAFPLFTLRPEQRCKSGEPACPLLLGLHSNAATVHASLAFWAPAAASGWLVAAPQSSQAIWKGAYVWDDRQLAESEVQKHFATLRETYAVDLRRTVIAGHSLGGEIAIWLALRNAIEMRGFLAIGPGGPFMDDLAEWQQLLQGRFSPGLRGVILIGSEDNSISSENIRTLVDRLNQAGVVCRLVVIAGAAHDHTPAYDPAVVRALDFIIAHP